MPGEVNRYLVRHDYGKGNLWAFVTALSKEEVEARFHSVKVYAELPDWFTPEMESAIATHSIDEPGGWLPLVLRNDEAANQ